MKANSLALTGILFLALLLAACLTPATPTPATPPAPPPAPPLAVMAPGAFSLEGLAGMKIGGGDCLAIVILDLPPVPLVDGTLFYVTVNRLTGKSVELQGKVHGAWWDADRQAWQDGWVERRCLVWR